MRPISPTCFAQDFGNWPSSTKHLLLRFADPNLLLKKLTTQFSDPGIERQLAYEFDDGNTAWRARLLRASVRAMKLSHDVIDVR